MKPQLILTCLAGLAGILLFPACGAEKSESPQATQEDAARQTAENEASEAPAGEVVTASIEDLESPICPVSGVDLRDAGIGAAATYEGKLYGFSCPHCKASFLEDPEKYLAQAEDPLEDDEALTPESPAAGQATPPAVAAESAAPDAS